jgi:hypothetical protein
MARLALLALVTLGLAACSQNEVGKKVITEQCIAEGETVEVCECFAKNVGREARQGVVRHHRARRSGRRFRDREDDRRAFPQQKAKLSAVAREVITTCGAEGYLAGAS